MLFVGVDLAWSPKNGSGVAVIEGDREKGKLLSASVVLSDEEIMNYIQRYVGKKNALIAIDAPLIVPNEEGRREAEALVSSLFRKYDAGAHPSNRKRLSQWSGSIRGENIAARLDKLGFMQDPEIGRAHV